MILNHKEAIDYLARHVDVVQPDETTIRTLHYLLADSLVAPGAAGQIREDSIRVSGTTYAPIDGRDKLTRLLLLLLEKARAILDPFEQSFFLLVHISYLQAFVDVNKRTARLASIIPLIRGDYVPQSFVEVDQDPISRRRSRSMSSTKSDRSQTFTPGRTGAVASATTRQSKWSGSMRLRRFTASRDAPWWQTWCARKCHPTR
jgi:Fic family protein